MALAGGEGDTTRGPESKPIPPAFGAASVGLRSRPGSSERDSQVRVFRSSLLQRLGPYEPVVTWLQSVLVWEKPLQSVLLYLVVNAMFWLFTLTSLRLFFLLCFGLIVVVCVDTWKNRIWPQIRVKQPGDSDNESWGLVHPRLLSVPELCHHMAEIWVSGASFAQNLVHFKQHNPGKFCLLVCGFFMFFAGLGRCVPGFLLSYFILLSVLLWPLAVYHRVGQRIHARLEPALLRLDFSVRGYMMSKRKERQMRGKPFCREPVADGSDSEEELAAFCPKLDDSLVARELAVTDSEHSDTEVSYTDNGTFNLSRGQTPLTEGSEDLDRHSDPEESFARDLPDFPSINPDATLLDDDDDDTSIGIPNVPYRSLTQEEARLHSDQEDTDTELPPAHDFTSDIAGIIASNMIQAALVGAIQGPARRDNPQRAPPRGYRKQSSSELDTDGEGDDFEMLDQSELNQIDPIGSQSGGSGQQQQQHSASGFLSNLLRKQ
ncbi:reticulophagy regulator 3-like [Acipenser ruthenus]|uniref:reticulophagy regulator 3-like n=1 Tax=Acipenser ruthenus TaxID=7906 RepID=UPI00145A7149|nr:reticulophagy regulator 3-like [Acipenser ruthenus]XP_058859098.1 reticulophagy regulator 3-like [Acipenser ruthenus]